MLSDKDLDELDRQAVKNLINASVRLSSIAIHREFARLILERAVKDVAQADYPAGWPESQKDGHALGILTAVTTIESLSPKAN